MATSSTVPPAIEGLPRAGIVDALRIAWWMRRGFWHGFQHSRGVARVVALYLAVAWWVLSPLVVVLQVVLVTCPWTRYYLSPERDVVLALFGTRTGWHIGDHIAAAPGTGRGRALRARLLPELLPVADARRVTIHATAASPELAALYMAELPGLVDVGGGMFRGRRLRRPPAA
ncbi:hypothetical protein [Clavibacter michiganensis]|uniref:hypothetical protein n=1 Tax=Clavibacter michiganensis TaxID=28447 RepID=UPI000696E2A4|nr:hypothetical protein [Clavibacter michiganensis]AWF99894.1 hypothetical protein BEH61_15415 [Clavibacter michiganensis subsp. insidiosus]